MAKQEAIEVMAAVIETLPNAMFRVALAFGFFPVIGAG
jgi:translation initiation factor IF-1